MKRIFNYKLKNVWGVGGEQINCNDNMVVLAEQTNINGSRRFFKEDVDSFMDSYLKDPKKHYYEVIVPEKPKKMYLDIDVNNTSTDLTNIDEVIWRFVEFVTRKLNEWLNMEMDEYDWIILNSSSEDKISYHFILDNRRLRFRKTRSMKLILMDIIEEYEKKYKHSIDNPEEFWAEQAESCLLYTSPSPRDLSTSRMPSSA